MTDLDERGYNMLLFPVFSSGLPFANADAEGCLTGHQGAAERFLEQSKGVPFGMSAYVDIISASAPSATSLSRFARNRRHWLLKNVAGRYAIQAPIPLAGGFCWTSIEFRRYLGNHLVDLFESYPFEHLILDVRGMPHETTEPSTWFHFGKSCLARMQAELNFNTEDFLRQPDLEGLANIARWRAMELTRFFENLKARVQKSRTSLKLILMGTGPDAMGNWEAAWLPAWRSGLVDGLILSGTPAAVESAMGPLDEASEQPRPYQFLTQTDGDLRDLSLALPESAATGFCVLSPGPLPPLSLPRAQESWAETGPLESNPLLALEAILKPLLAALPADHRLTVVLSHALRTLASSRETVSRDDLHRLQRDLLRVEKSLEDEKAAPAVQRLANLGRRLLALVPLQNMES